MDTTPQVRAGDSEDAINQVNQGMRAMPWYRDYLLSIGQSPDNFVHLDKRQAQGLLRAAQANGIQVDEGDVEIDPAGNFNPKGHKMRNALIAAAIAGGVVLTAGAAGAFAGGVAPGAAGTVGTGGSVGLGATGAGAASALEAGAIPGLAGSGFGGTALLGSTGVVGASALPAATSSLAGIGGGSTLGTVGSMSRLGNAARTGADAVSAATNAAANNRGMADQTNQQAGRDYENQYTNRAELEAQQRKQAGKDLYRAGWYQTSRQASPNNVRGLPPMNPDYMAGLDEMEKAALRRLQSPAQYDTTNMDPLKRFTPMPAGKGEKIGGYVAPALKTFASLYGAR